MGNSQASQEISLLEMEQFEMQVDEDYNPTGDMSERGARKQYLAKLRLREAEELRIKYLGPELALAQKKNDSLYHHGSRQTIKAQPKQN